MKQYRILACAFYPEMVNAYKLVASSMPQIHLNVYIGDRENIRLYLQMLSSTSYDAVIVPEEMSGIAESFPGIPIAEVELSPLDVLRTIRQAQQYNVNIILAVSRYHEQMVRQICDIMQYDYPLYFVESTGEIHALIRQLKKTSNVLLIGNVPVAQEASKGGVSSIFLSIGQDSIRKAFEKTISSCTLLEKQQSRVHLFQMLADKSPHNLAILDSDATVLYSNTALHIHNPASLFRILKNYVPQILEKGSVHLSKKVANTSVEIIGKRIDILDNPYIIYYYDRIYKNFQPVSVIHIENFDDQSEYSHFFYNSPEYCSLFSARIGSVSRSMMPTLIFGQSGTGRQYIARQIYWSSKGTAGPFVFLNCHNLTEKLWDDMLSDVNAPFYRTGYTFYFHDVHVLPLPLQEKLVDFITQTGLTMRCRLLSSTTRDLSSLVSSEQFSQELARLLSSYIINLPPLAERLEELPVFCGSMLNFYNSKYSRQIIGFSPEIYPLLSKVKWNTNFDQLEQMIHQLVVSKKDSYISVRDVKDCIEPMIMPAAASSDHPVSLKGTLAEIEARIISSVLEEEHMNQSAAAKRLGIGRTTLWRKLNT